MKVENETTGHNRTLRLTGIEGDRRKCGVLPELTITISYVNDDGHGIYKAITLDNVVIPAIIKALNRQRKGKS